MCQEGNLLTHIRMPNMFRKSKKIGAVLYATTRPIIQSKQN